MPIMNPARLKALRPDKSIADSDCRGLRAVRNHDGTLRFIYRWRAHDGKLRQRVIGDAAIMPIAEARAEVLRLKEVRRKGDDPAQALVAQRDERIADAAQVDYTVAAMIDDFYNKKLAATVRGKDRLRTLRVDSVDWARRPAASITRLDMQDKIDAIAERGAANTAGRFKRDFARAVEHAILRGRLPDDMPDPCRGVELPADAAYTARERAFSPKEWKAWLRWLPQSTMSDDVKDAMMLAALTAQRSGEITAMRWADLHDDEWRIAKRKVAGAHTVYLSPPALALLARRRRLHGASPFVFPSPVLEDRPLRQHALVWALVQVRDACPVPEWTTHDLRRSAATLIQSKGVTLPVLSRVLGHYSRGRGTTAIYAKHAYDTEARKAWMLLARTLATLRK